MSVTVKRNADIYAAFGNTSRSANNYVVVGRDPDKCPEYTVVVPYKN